MQQGQFFDFYTSLPLGDLIYALPGIQHVCNKYNRKANIFIGIDEKWPMAEQIMRRNGVTVTQKDFDLMAPLMKAQPYINDFKVRTDEKIHVDLTLIMHLPLNLPYGYIPRWYFHAFPDMACDLSVRWLHLDDRVLLMPKKMIVINRTSRYHNPNIDYTFLSKYADRILFVGLDDEWMSFCKTFFEVQRYEVQNFLELAMLINGCKFFIGNQSFCFSLAEALKVPRVLEIYSELPNVIPHGTNAYDFQHQTALEFYVEELMKL